MAHPKIVTAIAQTEFREFRRCIEKQPDFSLHLQPKDLQLLFDCANHFTNQLLIEFESALTYYLDEVDRGFFIVHPSWVNAMAAIDCNHFHKLALKWFKEMKKQYPNEQMGQPTIEAEKAIADLIELCRYAVQFEKMVLYVWIA